MESFSTKPMDFKFSKPDGAEASEPVMPAEPESTEYTPDELGSALAESIKSGSGDAVYQAIASIVAHCGK